MEVIVLKKAISFLKKDICPNRGKCTLRKKIRNIENNALNQLKRINIASLI